MPTLLNKLESMSVGEKWRAMSPIIFSAFYKGDFIKEEPGSGYSVFVEPVYTISTVVFAEESEKYSFPEFLSCVAAGKQGYSLGEYWQIGFPEDLREEFLYDGYIMFWPPDFSSEPEEFPVRIDHFCFAVKVAAVFYAEHIDEDFDPWPYFPAVDRFCLKYSDPATFNKEE